MNSALPRSTGAGYHIAWISLSGEEAHPRLVAMGGGVCGEERGTSLKELGYADATSSEQRVLPLYDGRGWWDSGGAAEAPPRLYIKER